MARRSRMSILKRQREVQKAEKAARKRAKRHGETTPQYSEPMPTVRLSELGQEPPGSEAEPPDNAD